MKPIVAVYCEGNDTKFAVFTKENGQFRMLKAASVDVFKPGKSGASDNDPLALIDSGGEIALDSIDASGLSTSSDQGAAVFESIVTAELSGIKLHKALFLPVLTEPSVFYSSKNKKTFEGHGLTSEMSTVVDESSSKKKSKNDEVNKVDIADGGSLYAYLSADVPCFKMINSIARLNGKRFYKIQSVKSAEISLSYYVAKKKKFFPDDYSLIVYIG
ncbi:MAG: hypothetical protein Q8Q47_10225, partial [Ignavibacteriaceae bacterium]|nr:hypothetical protein [Ignavibacteriaceae bacterium]